MANRPRRDLTTGHGLRVLIDRGIRIIRSPFVSILELAICSLQRRLSTRLGIRIIQVTLDPPSPS